MTDQTKDCCFPGDPSRRDRMAEQMGGWLTRVAKWDLFFTGTWSRPVTSDGVRYGTRKYFRWVEKRAGQAIYYFWGAERGETGGLLHIHALVGNVAHLKPWCFEKLPPDVWGEQCCLLHGWPWGYARAVIYDPALGAAHYVTKYVVKNLCDWDLHGLPISYQRAFPPPQRRVAAR